MKETEIIKWQPIHAMIEEYQKAQAEIVEGFKLLSAAKGRLEIFGEYNNGIIDHDLCDYDIGNGATETSLAKIKRGAWRGIVDKAQLRNLMTEARNRRLNDQLEEKGKEKLPELTVENVHAFIEGMSSNLDTLLAETIKETFDILRPRRSEYKTNTEYEIGDRVILNYMADTSCGGCHINYHSAEQRLRCIDNVFHLLDGQGPIKWPGDLVTIVREAMQNKQWACETGYFECKWFKKGSMHIKFKRMDLVKELNKRAGGNRLKEG